MLSDRLQSSCRAGYWEQYKADYKDKEITLAEMKQSEAEGRKITAGVQQGQPDLEAFTGVLFYHMT